MEPSTMSLQRGESQTIRIWALPQEEGVFKEELICVVKDDPNPVIWRMRCLGVFPKVELSTREIKFERLLLDQSAKQVLEIKNKCKIRVKWKLTGLEELPEEFSFQVLGVRSHEKHILEGELEPTDAALIEITFKAIKQQEFNDMKLQIDVEDIEGMGQKQNPEELEVAVIAEAFEITVDFHELEDGNRIEFGDVRVGDIEQKSFKIENKGLYDVKFDFVLTRVEFNENFKIIPQEGVLKPNETLDIKVQFQSVDELKLPRGNVADIAMNILEGASLEKFDKVMIFTGVNSVFSKYMLKPNKMISLPPMLYDEDKTIEFEIQNICQFPFNYTIFNYDDDETRMEIR